MILFACCLQHVIGVTGKHFKIVDAVVASVAILVMNNLVRQNVPAKVLLHHKSVYGNISAMAMLRVWVAWAVFVHIAA
jgi:hypothetical protein